MRKFKRAQAQNQASIEKHLSVAANLDSSSDDDDEKERDRMQRAVSKVVLSYSGEGGDVEKSLSYLADVFQSGGAICLICISSVKKIEPIWSCSVCFSFMHLTCIRHWIRDSLESKRENGRDLLWAWPLAAQTLADRVKSFLNKKGMDRSGFETYGTKHAPVSRAVSKEIYIDTNEQPDWPKIQRRSSNTTTNRY